MKKLLIVDDEPDIRRTLSLLFKDSYEVLEAGDGNEAVRLAGSRAPDLVFLDVVMPGMDGLAALESLKKVRPNMIVIMLTGEQEIAVAKEALDHGASMYVTKPYEPNFLRAEVERLLTAGPAKANEKPWRVAEEP